MNSSENSKVVQADELDFGERRILSIIHLNTNPVQGEWVSERVVKTIGSSAGLDGSTTEDKLDELEEEGLVIEKENRYQTAKGVGRPKHPGEN
ncbi:hypothetical protein [Haloarcula sp. Atlit-7R]|uniref:hypothetical protein n=1 Tax=Haloarcula sp. Atlit-7R TaxID=2282125 RepID=UPI000EF14364|nr:hypothetical protein [Haloarcula sp. Atlit-7R]RLM94312.1 hypothetical protein D3D01_15730 [Haloarcula sp. Atlit-7R]